VSTVEALADMTPEQLEAIEGIGPKTVEKISIAVNNYFSSLEGGEAVAAAELEGAEEAPVEEASAESPEAPVEAAAESESGEVAEGATQDAATDPDAAEPAPEAAGEEKQN
jgi:N utilization substance protein A